MSAPTATATTATSTEVTKTTLSTLFYRFGAWLFDLLSRPQPSSPLLRRRERAFRHYRRQHLGRLRLHRTAMVVSALICIICVGLTLAFFYTDLIRPHLAPNTPFAGITVLLALFGVATAIHAGFQLRGINAEARRFGEFYTNCVNDDGTISVDPASDHDYGNRVINGRVFVRMSEVYSWYCKQN